MLASESIGPSHGRSMPRTRGIVESSSDSVLAKFAEPTAQWLLAVSDHRDCPHLKPRTGSTSRLVKFTPADGLMI